jgi:hypothetical protein
MMQISTEYGAAPPPTTYTEADVAMMVTQATKKARMERWYWLAGGAIAAYVAMWLWSKR